MDVCTSKCIVSLQSMFECIVIVLFAETILQEYIRRNEWAY